MPLQAEVAMRNPSPGEPRVSSDADHLPRKIDAELVDALGRP